MGRFDNAERGEVRHCEGRGEALAIYYVSVVVTPVRLQRPSLLLPSNAVTCPGLRACGVAENFLLCEETLSTNTSQRGVLGY